jgi:hypothetical protein
LRQTLREGILKGKSKPRCPFVENPVEECYVARMDSGAVEKTLRFCRGIYEKCEIYLRRTSPHKETVREEMKSMQKTTTEQGLQPISRTDKEAR